MGNVIDILEERGFIEKTTHDAELRAYLEEKNKSCYIGFDPTASSLHVGSLVPIMSLAHMQRNGHRPIALVGGGTGLIGDPSGKTEMRKFLTPETIEENARGIQTQLSRFIDFSDDKALMLNNAAWLNKLEYIPLLRDIGRHFSVNRMIKAESYRMRLDSEEGLSFIEFNYMILQAYDFSVLMDRYGCGLQMGGSDQWGNIVAGIDLIRRMQQRSAFGITFPLIMTSSGIKMGKTHKGAIWLDPKRTSPYDYFQFWVNTDDRDVARFLALFTFLPMPEIKQVEQLEGADLNSAKIILAFEATVLAHGKEEADKAYAAAKMMFGLKKLPENILPGSTILRTGNNIVDNTSVPATNMDQNELFKGIPLFKLFAMVGLAKSGGAARRLISQGGGYINGNRIQDAEYMVNEKDLSDNIVLLRAGKKRYHKIVVS